ncbi:MAG: hypothetical protein V4613_05275 [Bacteroidota bacterium]
MKRLFAVLTLAISVNVHSQAQNDPFGTNYNYDSTTYSDTAAVLQSESTTETTTTTTQTFLPYVRFKAPMDTLTQLVTYMGVVDYKQIEDDEYEGGIDSLYWRAKKFLLLKYVENFRAKASKDFIFPKELLVEDYKPDGDVGRLIIKPTIRLVLQKGNNNPVDYGTITFKIDLRVKEDKYKYKFTNFVHHTKEMQTGKSMDVYAEFYVNTKRTPRTNDQILIAIDREVKAIIKALNVVMKDPIIKNEDDF